MQISFRTAVAKLNAAAARVKFVFLAAVFSLIRPGLFEVHLNIELLPLVGLSLAGFIRRGSNPADAGPNRALTRKSLKIVSHTQLYHLEEAQLTTNFCIVNEQRKPLLSVHIPFVVQLHSDFIVS